MPYAVLRCSPHKRPSYIASQ
ncbi:hypothetical protein MED222_05630 [Vibrio sp. MED222]|nr:hypothetical protein MED222_05630 [Vibrio sp. MED222]